ncbi:hypothetical protein JCM10908_004705 [Rhodotorula pacifica]|uniref:bL21 family ribosomal protein n=1 Tax=Rhodotorula pacifica TaxID=1495444 RepID=UPI0031713006
MLSRALASTSRLAASACSACSAAAAPLAPAAAARTAAVRTPKASRWFSHSARASHDAAPELPTTLPRHAQPHALEPDPLPTNAPPSEPSALALLKSQPSHYITALFMGRRYLLSPGDVLTVPHLKNAPVGSRLALTRILEVGSRDYTLRAGSASSPAASISSVSSAQLASHSAPHTARPPSSRSIAVGGVPKDWQRHPDSLPHLGDEIVRAEVTVLEHTKGAMFEVEKFKRRKGYRRTLRSKLGFTKLRVGEIELGPKQ